MRSCINAASVIGLLPTAGYPSLQDCVVPTLPERTFPQNPHFTPLDRPGAPNREGIPGCTMVSVPNEFHARAAEVATRLMESPLFAAGLATMTESAYLQVMLQARKIMIVRAIKERLVTRDDVK